MKGKAFLIVLIVILVILNLGTLTFIWIHRPTTIKLLYGKEMQANS